MSGCPQCVWLFTVSGCPHSTACLNVQLSTMYLVVHGVSGCPQCAWLFIACLDVHTPQHVWMSTMCLVVHNMSGCPHSTACLDVHNVSGCPQHVWMSTMCLVVHSMFAMRVAIIPVKRILGLARAYTLFSNMHASSV